MAKKLKKMLSLLLAFSMVLSMLSVTAFADDGDTPDGQTVMAGEEDGEGAGVLDDDEVDKNVGPAESEEPKETEEPDVTVDPEESKEPEEPVASVEDEEPADAEEAMGADVAEPFAQLKTIDSAFYYFNLNGSEEYFSKSPNKTTMTVENVPAEWAEAAAAEGYVFKGWKSGVVVYQPGDTYRAATGTGKMTVTLYAVWEIPVTADEAVAEINGVYYRTVKDAVSEAVNGGTIILLQDVKENLSISSKTLILDLNGHNITYPENRTGGAAIYVQSSANVTINGNGTVYSATTVAVYNTGATLTVNGGTYVSDYANNGAIFTATQGSGTNAKTIINGGEVAGITVRSNQKLGGATLEFNGGTVTGTGNAKYGIELGSEETCVITGGTIYGGVGSSDRVGSLTITGGTIYGGVCVATWNGNTNVSSPYGITSASIEGGYIDGDVVCNLNTVSVKYFKNFTITGGHFTTDVSELTANGKNCVPDGYHCVPCNDVAGYSYEVGAHDYVCSDNGDGTHSTACVCGDVKEANVEHTYENGECVCGAKKVTGVAMIKETGVGYSTLPDAIKDATPGQTVVLLKDVSTYRVTIGNKTLTLDLDGHTISVDDTAAIQIYAGTNLTITGDGNIINTSTGGSSYGVYNNGGTLTLESGTITANGGYGLYTSSTTTDVADTIVNGGTVIGPTGAVVRLSNASSASCKAASLTINGGTIIGTSDGKYECGVGVHQKATCVINDGTISSPNWGVSSSEIITGKVTINGGTISGGVYGAYLRGTAGSMTITDGFFTGNVGAASTKKPVISGGHFTVDVSAYVVKDKACIPCTHPDYKDAYAYHVDELPGYTVTFNANATFSKILGANGEVLVDSTGSNPNDNTYAVTVKSGKTIEALPTAERNATYRFGGWFTADGVEFTSATVVTVDVTVYAKWVQVYTINFAKDSKTGLTFDPIAVDAGDAADLTAVNAQIKAAGEALGYEFMGWADNSMVTNAIVADGDSYTPTKTITLKAVWQILPTTPTFDRNATQIQLKVVDENGVSLGNYGFWDDVNYNFYSVGEVTANDGTNPNAPAKDYPYQCTLTLDVARMLLDYKEYHELTSDASVEITIYCSSTGRWAALPDGGYSYVVQHTATVKHTAAAAVKENEVADTCTENGSYDLVEYCSVCNKEMSRETKTVEATGHDWDDGKVETGSTCTAEGNMLYTCKVCGETKKVAISAEGHTWAEAWTSDGTHHWHVCLKCGASDEEVAHTPEIIPGVAPTFDSTGLTDGVKCSVCGKILVPQQTRPMRTRPGTTVTGGSEVDIDEPDVPLAELPLPFVDVADDSWYRDSVAYAYYNNLMFGVGNETFDPDGFCDRATVATVLHRLENTPAVEFSAVFSDVKDGMWYTSAIEWGAANGLLQGYGNTKFGTLDQVTREQLATFLYRYAQFKGYDVSASASLSAFKDGDQVSVWAKDAMSWAVAMGLFQADDNGCLNPTAFATRADIAMLLMQFSENVAKKGLIA